MSTNGPSPIAHAPLPSGVRGLPVVVGSSAHPRDVLLAAQAGRVILPVCDHYSGVEARMKKSLALQAEMIEEFGVCVFDATLDLEDGAPVGGETDHANMAASLIECAQAATKNVAYYTVNTSSKTPQNAALNKAQDAASYIQQRIPQRVHQFVQQRIGVRVHSIAHPAFESDVEHMVKTVGQHLAYIVIPKVETLSDVEFAAKAIDAAGGAHIPLHVLIESSAAVHQAFSIAAHPRIESISFGLMDFVSSHSGAIPADAMGSKGQFSHPLVLRAKLEISAACHAFGKVPSHCVVTEFADPLAIEAAARKASRELGYTRMWSIHPSQIRPILAAFAPSMAEIETASKIIAGGAQCDWAPSSFLGVLHDRASYRYYWQVLERAHSAGCAMPQEAARFFGDQARGVKPAQAHGIAPGTTHGIQTSAIPTTTRAATSTTTSADLVSVSEPITL